jgi:MipA family protein
VLPNNVKHGYVASLGALFLAGASIRCTAAASEATSDAVAGWSGMVGTGAIYMPSYPGSPNMRALPLPMLALEYRDPAIGTFALDEDGLSWTFVEANAMTAGVVLGYDAGRSDHHDKGDLLSTGDNRLLGMGNLGATLEAGAILGYGPMTLIASQALGNAGHGGFVADLEIGQTVDLSDDLALTFGVGTQWGDQTYMQSWFGVTAAQAAASRFSAHTAAKGFVYAGALVGIEYQLFGSWSTKLEVTYMQLIDEAKKSSLAEERRGVQVFAGMAWHFE